MSERYVSGYLDPVRLNESILQDLRKQGSRYYSSQYQQNPIPSDGEIVKSAWLEIITEAEFNQMILSKNVYDKYNRLESSVDVVWDFFSDTAEGVGSGDAHAVLIATKFENTLYVKWVDVSRLEIPDLIRRMNQLMTTYGDITKSKLYIEPKSTGRTIVQTIKRESMINVIMNDPPRDSKKARLLAITPKLETRRVKLIRGPWNEAFITELIGFPNMKHDDQVDVLEMAVRKLLTNSYQNNFMF
jgi:predicted phage terminase large subunit-like protein